MNFLRLKIMSLILISFIVSFGILMERVNSEMFKHITKNAKKTHKFWPDPKMWEKFKNDIVKYYMPEMTRE